MFAFPQKKALPPIEHIDATQEPDVLINGAMRGAILGKGNIKVDVKGHCEGALSAKELNIFGTVIGDIYADELIVHPTGRLYYGQVNVKNSTIHEGAVYLKREENKDKPVKAEPVVEPEVESKRKGKGPNFVITY